MKCIQYFFAVSLLIVFAYVGASAYPQPLFSHHTRYQNYEIWSDRPIPPQIAQVLDDANRRLHTSELYGKDGTYKIFFCNDSWRLWFYGHLLSAQVGGVADMVLTRNIYIRASDIASNRIYPPGPGPIADAGQRTLAYFIAHEAAHIMVSRQFGRLAVVRDPQWLLEGYADYIGKGGDFDFDENYRLFKADSPLLDFQRSGLYRGFHLRVSLLLDKRGLSVRQVFANPPGWRELSELLKQRTFALPVPASPA